MTTHLLCPTQWRYLERQWSAYSLNYPHCFPSFNSSFFSLLSCSVNFFLYFSRLFEAVMPHSLILSWLDKNFKRSRSCFPLYIIIIIFLCLALTFCPVFYFFCFECLLTVALNCTFPFTLYLFCSSVLCLFSCFCFWINVACLYVFLLFVISLLECLNSSRLV